MPELGILILIADSCTRWRGIFEGLLQDGGRADFYENLRASLVNDDLSKETTSSQIHLAGQYLDWDCLGWKSYDWIGQGYSPPYF
jgi:hypothetical protein